MPYRREAVVDALMALDARSTKGATITNIWAHMARTSNITKAEITRELRSLAADGLVCCLTQAGGDDYFLPTMDLARHYIRRRLPAA